MVDDGRLISLGELLDRAAQDFPPFQVMGNAAIAQVDAMVIEQAVLTRNLQMVASAQCGSETFQISTAFLNAATVQWDQILRLLLPRRR